MGNASFEVKIRQRSRNGLGHRQQRADGQRITTALTRMVKDVARLGYLGPISFRSDRPNADLIHRILASYEARTAGVSEGTHYFRCWSTHRWLLCTYEMPCRQMLFTSAKRNFRVGSLQAGFGNWNS